MVCSVRRAAPADASAACEVVRRSISELCVADHHGAESTLSEWLANKAPENFERWSRSDRHVALVAESDEAIVGFGLLDLSGVIALLYVSPDARFSGVSKALLAAIEEEAHAAGIDELRLESTLTAQLFYERAGYSSSGDATRGVGETCCYPLSRKIGVRDDCS